MARGIASRIEVVRPKVVPSPLPLVWRPKGDDICGLEAQVGRDARVHLQRLVSTDTPVCRLDGVCLGCSPEAGKVLRLVKTHPRRAVLFQVGCWLDMRRARQQREKVGRTRLGNSNDVHRWVCFRICGVAALPRLHVTRIRRVLLPRVVQPGRMCVLQPAAGLLHVVKTSECRLVRRHMPHEAHTHATPLKDFSWRRSPNWG
jgi:hypothetical protein